MFKNLKSLFIVEEEGAPKKKASNKKAAPPTSKSPEKIEKVEATPTEVGAGKVTQKFMDVLFKAMEKNNLEGFDYLEFKQSMASLKKMSMDEPTRYQSAFAMAQTMGATPDHLVKTAQHYINILRKEEEKFEAALAKQNQVQIGDKQNQIKQLDDTIKAKAAQIQKLTKEIEAHQKQSKSLKGQINKASVKVQTTKNNFIASYKSLVGQIAADVENMKKYLK